ncbi:MAG TPA: DUF116 domain-containing protein [Bacteroidota bacterium]|nr:DUF116 domain-containing protein [Bacteroidota bacterium]
MPQLPVTYQLNVEGAHATSYYRDASSFTDEVLARAQSRLIPAAVQYRDYLVEHSLESPRSVEEYAFELLNLGVLWRTYGQTALAVRLAPFHFLSNLGEWRKTHQRLKPSIDVLRGVLLSLFLVPVPIERTLFPPISLSEIGRLVTWLEATGDFREDAFRYVRWLGYMGGLDADRLRDLMDEVLDFADWFDSISTVRMGSYTPNVDSFLTERSSFYTWREDRFACLRSRTEYHLTMVGAEIMNRAFRDEFLACERKTVLAPGCMRARTADKCEGTNTPDGIRCTGCEASCNVNKLRETGLRNGFDVVVIPHSTDLSRWAAKPGAKPNGVVGVACLSVLLEGGWELKRYDVPAQCILLNQCGCNKHWHEKGFPTNVDVRQLKSVVNAQVQPAMAT